MGKEDPLTPGKGERKEEGRRRGCLLKGVYGWGGAGGGESGNRKETEARDMKSKARSWGSPTLEAWQRLGRHFSYHSGDLQRYRRIW